MHRVDEWKMVCFEPLNANAEFNIGFKLTVHNHMQATPGYPSYLVLCLSPNGPHSTWKNKISGLTVQTFSYRRKINPEFISSLNSEIRNRIC